VHTLDAIAVVQAPACPLIFGLLHVINPPS